MTRRVSRKQDAAPTNESRSTLYCSRSFISSFFPHRVEFLRKSYAPTSVRAIQAKMQVCAITLTGFMKSVLVCLYMKPIAQDNASSTRKGQKSDVRRIAARVGGLEAASGGIVDMATQRFMSTIGTKINVAPTFETEKACASSLQAISMLGWFKYNEMLNRGRRIRCSLVTFSYQQTRSRCRGINRPKQK